MVRVHAQTIELFVEPGVNIVGEPGSRTLDAMSDDTIAINKEGVILFKADPGGDGAFEALLKAEEKNVVTYLLGRGFTLQNNRQITDIDRNELKINNAGEFAVRGDLADPFESDGDINILIQGNYAGEDLMAVVVETGVQELFQFSEKSNALYSTFETSPPAVVPARLYMGSRNGSSVVMEQGTLVPGSNSVWTGFNADTGSAALLEDLNPEIPDTVLFANEFITLQDNSGLAAFYSGTGGYTQLYSSIGHEPTKTIVHPYDQTRYLIWLSSEELGTGHFIHTFGGGLGASNMIASTDKANPPLVGPDGMIYLTNGQRGISRYHPDGTPLQQIVSTADIDTNDAALIGISDTELLIVLSHIDDDPVSLYAYNIIEGTIGQFLTIGTVVDGLAVGKIGDDQNSDDEKFGRWPGIAMEGNYMAVLADIGILRIFLAEFGPVFTVSELCPEIPQGFVEKQSFDESEINYPDPFTSTEPIDLREGPCGGNWHTRIWKDPATETELDWIPGTPEHTDDSVSVQNTDLVISDGPITLRSANLSGSLTVSQPLTVEKESSIQNLTLKSDLNFGANLSLEGDSTFSNLAIVSGGGVLKQDGIAFLIEGGMVVDIENSGGFRVETGSSIIGDVTNTGLFEFSGDALEGSVDNSGDFLIAFDGEPLDVSGVDFRNLSEGVLNVNEDSAYELKSLENGGQVNIETATLTVNGEVLLTGGGIHLEENATLILKPSATEAVRITDDVLIDDDSMSNGLQIVTSEFNIAAGATLATSVFGSTGLGFQDAHVRLEGDGLKITGGGLWNNSGGLILGSDSLINDVEVTNTGAWFFDGDEFTVSLLGANFVNSEDGSVEFRSNLILLDNVHLTNKGYFTLIGSIKIYDEDPSSKGLSNFVKGTLIKRGSGEARLEVPVLNKGLIAVQEGSLVIGLSTELHDKSSILVEKEGALSFATSAEGFVS